MFARAVDEDPTIQAALETVILHKVDCEKGEGVEVAKRFGVRGYPTFKMVNGEGAELERWIGYDGPEAWAGVVADGVADQRTLEAKAEAYKAQPTAALARSLANAQATVYDWKGAVDYFRAALDLDPDGAAGYQENILAYTYYGTYGDEPAYGAAEVEAAARAPFAREDQTVDGKLQIASMVTGAARKAGSPELAIPYLEQAMAAAAGGEDEGVVRSRDRLAVDHALLVEKDADKAVTLKKAAQPEGWQDDPRRLNAFAWWCFENEVNLEEAETLAVRGVELATSDEQRASILDTAAEICHLRGNCDDAIARIRQAIELQPDNEHYKAQLARFEETRAAAKG